MWDLPHGVKVGEVLEARYRILDVVGGGAMGTVVAAHHLLLDRKVAIKFLVPEAIGRERAIARFVREARATVRLESEHVVRVLDVALLRSGAPYIVMEHLEGCDLAVWLKTRSPLPVSQAVDFILQACDGIAEAHGHGIIHRDIKPANVFAVQRAGSPPLVKVLDFGISKVDGLVSRTLSPEDSVGSSNTHDRIVMGTPVYMSPEQMFSARDVDSRTDIWALGVTLFELVTGRLPFPGRTLLEIHTRIVNGSPVLLREVNSELPGGLEIALLRCLERNRDRRYASVKEFAEAITPFGSSRSGAHFASVARRGSSVGSAPDSALACLFPNPVTLPSRLAEDTSLSEPPTPNKETTRNARFVIRLGWPRSGFLLALGLGMLLTVSTPLVWNAKFKSAPAPPTAAVTHASVPAETSNPPAAGLRAPEDLSRVSADVSAAPRPAIVDAAVAPVRPSLDELALGEATRGSKAIRPSHVATPDVATGGRDLPAASVAAEMRPVSSAPVDASSSELTWEPPPSPR